MISQGPIVIFISSIGKDIWSYKSGIIDISPEFCTLTNHFEIAVGYGYDENNRLYIKIRNSWGSDWAENRYMRIYYNQNTETCKVTSRAFQPIL